MRKIMDLYDEKIWIGIDMVMVICYFFFIGCSKRKETNHA